MVAAAATNSTIRITPALIPKVRCVIDLDRLPRQEEEEVRTGDPERHPKATGSAEPAPGSG